MGKYDLLDREYFGDPERFAELIEVGVLKKRGKINAAKLKNLDGKYPSFRNKSGEYERDELKLYEDHKVKYGIELENHMDYGMSRRIFVYDAAEYEKDSYDRAKAHKQHGDLKNFEEIKSGKHNGEKEYPIVNLVLYLGMGRYKGSRSLRDEFYEMHEDIKPYLHGKVQNYSYSIMEADFVNPKDFTTELRQFFEAMQARNNKDEMLNLLERVDFHESFT